MISGILISNSCSIIRQKVPPSPIASFWFIDHPLYKGWVMAISSHKFMTDILCWQGYLRKGQALLPDDARRCFLDGLKAGNHEDQHKVELIKECLTVVPHISKGNSIKKGRGCVSPYNFSPSPNLNLLATHLLNCKIFQAVSFRIFFCVLHYIGGINKTHP